jgi:hypothetical protein
MPTAPVATVSAGGETFALGGASAAEGRDTVRCLMVWQFPSLSSFCPPEQVLATHLPFASISVFAHSSGQTRDDWLRIAPRNSVEGLSGARDKLAALTNFTIDCLTAGDVQSSSSLPA